MPLVASSGQIVPSLHFSLSLFTVSRNHVRTVGERLLNLTSQSSVCRFRQEKGGEKEDASITRNRRSGCALFENNYQAIEISQEEIRSRVARVSCCAGYPKNRLHAAAE